MLGMDVSANTLSLITSLVLFTSFVKVTTALSIVRYGLGLLGVEVGVAVLVASCALAVIAAPPELKGLGAPLAFSSDASAAPSQGLSAEQVAKTLTPYMLKRIDMRVAAALSLQTDERGELSGDARSLAPAFLVSELQEALKIGCLLLVPFVVLDLVIAHLLTLVGVRQLSAQVVSLPCKLLLFLSVDGWTLVVKKLLVV